MATIYEIYRHSHLVEVEKRKVHEKSNGNVMEGDIVVIFILEKMSMALIFKINRVIKN